MRLPLPLISAILIVVAAGAPISAADESTCASCVTWNLGWNGGGGGEHVGSGVSRKGYLSLADLDGDGTISREEVQATHERVRRRAILAGLVLDLAFERVDKDGDGTVTGDELRSARAFPRLFQRLDTDADGRLSRTELEQMLRARNQGVFTKGQRE